MSGTTNCQHAAMAELSVAEMSEVGGGTEALSDTETTLEYSGIKIPISIKHGV